MSLIALILILVATNVTTLYYFTLYEDFVPAEDVPMAIEEVMDNFTAFDGKVVTLRGYYVFVAGYHLLVSNPLSCFNNSLTFDNHVVLAGEVPETIQDTVGKQISVKGRLEIDTGTTELGDDSGLFYIDSFFDVHTELTVDGPYIDRQMDPYLNFSLIEPLYDPLPEKYAVLYSGGDYSYKAHFRYWNDIIYMYYILTMHGYPPENIYVVYKNGVAEDTWTPVDYPATHDSLDTVFGELADRMDSRDTLFFFTTNHGGYGGISVWNPMDSSGPLTHSEVANWLDMITCNRMIIVMEQCVSGKFISYLSAPDRVILTACTAYQYSYACDDEGNWDEFVYHFMCALVQFHWNGDSDPVQSDLNDDGLISMREAFIWAATMDNRPETPWYNDNGSGVGHHLAEVMYGPGDWPGDNIFL
jgi:hypothetical protein